MNPATKTIKPEPQYLVDGKYTFEDLVDIDQLRVMFEKFSRATGYTTGLVSFPDQKLLIGTGWRDICTQFHRAFATSEGYCKQSNLDLTAALREQKMLNVRPCESGLVDGATPIIIQGAHVANLFTGQILLEEPDIERFRKQGRAYGYDVDDYLKALAAVPVVTEQEFAQALAFLREMAVMLAELGLTDLESRRIVRESKKSAENLRTTLNSIGDAVISTDTAGHVTRVNPVAEVLTGWTFEQARGQPLTEVFHIINAQTRDPVVNPVERVLANGKIVGLANHAALIARDGREYQIADSAAPILDAAGKVTGVVLVFRDVTAEYQLREERRCLATIIEQAVEGIAVADLAGYIQFANRAWATLHGYKNGDELVGAHLNIFHTAQQVKTDVIPFNTEVMQRGHKVGEVGHMRQDGTPFPTLMTVTLLKDTHGTPYAIAGFVQDITARKRLERHEEYLDQINQIIIKSSDIPKTLREIMNILLDVFDCDRAWLLYPCDPTVESYTIPIMKTKVAWYVPEGLEIDIDAAARAVMQRALESGTPVGCYTSVKPALPENIKKEFHVQSQLITAIHPDIDKGWLLGMHQCTHERIWTEEEKQLYEKIGMRIRDALNNLLLFRNMQASEKRYRLIAENVADVIWTMGIKLDFTYISPSVYQQRGYTVKQVMLHSLNETMTPASLEKTMLLLGQMLALTKAGNVAGWEAVTFEAELYCQDGTTIWTHNHAKILPGPDGQPASILGVTHDITARKRAEKKLAMQKQRLDDILTGTNAGTWNWNVQTGAVTFNARWAEIMGHTLEELEPIDIQTWINSVHPDDLPHANAQLEQHFTGQQDYYDVEFRQSHQDGGWVWVNARGKVVEWTRDGKPLRMSGTHLDITERKQVEEEVRHLRNYLANIIDSMPSVLVGVAVDGTVTQWNTGAQRATGLSPDDAVGQSLAQVLPHLAVEMERVHQAMQSREVQIYPKRARRENGATIYEDVTIYPLSAADASQAHRVEGAVIRVDDVTERVRLEEMIIQSEKMLSVGGLAAGMAHEINNPLAGMMQTASVMANRLTSQRSGDIPANLQAAEAAGTSMAAIRAFMESRGIPRMLAAINESGRRAAAIVDNMLSFARRSDAIVSSHDMADLLDKTVELAATDYDLKKQYDFKTITIAREYETDLPYVPCEGSKIQQMFLNILRNGAQAMQAAGSRRQEAGGRKQEARGGMQDAETEPRFVLRLAHEREAGMIRIEIEDNGPGMTAAVRKRVFEPFFTTKPVGVGTGLGLSVSYFIVVENHGGTLDVVSEAGQGATFIIRLPLERKRDKL